MTATVATAFPMAGPSRWNVFFAEDFDKDLDFDEGFEEDELHQSKPPSRRPLLWIILLILVGAVAYWTLNNPSSQMPGTSSLESMETLNSTPSEEALVSSPAFREDQTVLLVEAIEEAMLSKDPTNSEPGPKIKSGERLTILDGSHQITGWIYQVQTTSGNSGWIPEEKLKAAL